MEGLAELPDQGGRFVKAARFACRKDHIRVRRQLFEVLLNVARHFVQTNADDIPGHILGEVKAMGDVRRNNQDRGFCARVFDAVDS